MTSLDFKSLKSALGIDSTRAVGGKPHFPGSKEENLRSSLQSSRCHEVAQSEPSPQNKEHWVSVFKIGLVTLNYPHFLS